MTITTTVEQVFILFECKFTGDICAHWAGDHIFHILFQNIFSGVFSPSAII